MKIKQTLKYIAVIAIVAFSTFNVLAVGCAGEDSVECAAANDCSTPGDSGYNCYMKLTQCGCYKIIV
jgi:hypothetical protein